MLVSSSRYVVRCERTEDESTLGFALREAEANRFPQPQPGGTAEAPPSKVTPGRSPARVVLHGTVTLASNLVDRRRPKVCPACIAVRPVLPFTWDLSFWTACPVHGSRMLATCPACDAPLRWDRQRLDRCCKNVPFAAEPVQAAPAETVDLVRLIAFRTGATAPLPTKSLMDRAGHLSLADTLALVRLLGGLRLDRMTHSRAATKPTLRDAEGIVDEAARILACWPSGLHDALAASSGTHPTSDVSLRARFGPAYHRVKNGSRGPLAFVSDEMRRFGASQNLASSSEPLADEALVPLHKARLAHRLSYENARRLVRRGVLQVEKRRMGKFTQLLVRPLDLGPVSA